MIHKYIFFSNYY